jgi:hypothetical protein
VSTTNLGDSRADCQRSESRQQLPANIDAERSILGGILLDNCSYKDAEHLKPEDFSLDAHRRLYARIRDLAVNSRPIDIITLPEELERRKELDLVGGAAYIASLLDGVPDRPSIKHYVKMVRDKALLRGVIHTANVAISRAADGSDTAELIIHDIAANIASLSEKCEAAAEIIRGDGDVQNQANPDPVARADMPEDVLDGRLGEIYSKYLRAYPRAYAWPILATAAGVLVERNDHPIRTNLFCCTVGPVGSGKTACAETVFRLLGTWEKHPSLLKAKFGSAEGLIEKLQDVEPGASRLVFPDELGHLMTKAAIDRSALPFVLNSAYNADHQCGGTKGKSFTLDCRLSIVGGVVEELFGDSFGLATTGGVYDRFVYGLYPDPHEFSWRPFSGNTLNLEPFLADVEIDVWNLRDAWLKDGISGRVAENALRVAYICACVDGRPTLRAQDLGPAEAFARYQLRVRNVLAPNPGENGDARCAFAIRGWLGEHGSKGQWINRRALDRSLHTSRRFGPGVFNRCLVNLALNREIETADNGHILRWLVSNGDKPGDAW